MMGPARDGQGELFLYGVKLGERVPKEHPLRRIQKKIDFGFVRQEVSESYGHNGHVSEDPVVILKLMFLLFFEDVKSERELMRILPYRLDWLWFLKMGLEDEIPHHSILSKARRRWGTEVFRELFVRVLKVCQKEGLIDGGKVHIDGSLVDADASCESVVERRELSEGEWQRVWTEQAGKLTETEGRLVSRTDPDAVMVKHRRRGSRPRYKHHRMVDDRKGVITAIKTTPAHVAEPQELQELLDEHEGNTGERVETVVADSQYGTNEQFLECQQRGIRTHMKDLRATQKGNAKLELFTVEDFEYDKERDRYRCPGGHELRRKSYSGKARYVIYGISNRHCSVCPLREQCTRSKRGRRLKVAIGYEWIAKGREQSHSEAARQDLHRRTYLMEGSFADAVNNHHFRRARWRGLKWQAIQDYLIATSQNLRKVLRASSPETASFGRFCARLTALLLAATASGTLPQPHSRRTLLFAPALTRLHTV